MILRNSRGTIEDLGPSRARCAGYGGSLATHAITPMKSPWKRTPERVNNLSELRKRPRCGKIMPRLKEPCYRRFGHRDVCKNYAAVLADTERRRVAK